MPWVPGRNGLAVPQVHASRLARVDEPEDDEPVPDATADGDVVTTRKRPRFAYRPQLLVVDGGYLGADFSAAAIRTLDTWSLGAANLTDPAGTVWELAQDIPAA